jgi:hypothetical protein
VQLLHLQKIWIFAFDRAGGSIQAGQRPRSAVDLFFQFAHREAFLLRHLRRQEALARMGDSGRMDAMESAGRGISIRDSVLVGLALFTLAPAGEALAGDPAAIAGALDTSANNLRQFLPPAIAPTADPASAGLFSSAPGDFNPAFSTTDFRPRKHSVFDSDPRVNSFGDAPMLRNTTIWQRMSQYKSHDRVRLLTLWESSGSTVSLQAGKGGNPSLQWTSRVMNRGGSTHGLLDQLFSVSLAHAGNGLHASARSPTAPASNKQTRAPGVADLK